MVSLRHGARTPRVVTGLPAQMLGQAADAHVPPTVKVGTVPAETGHLIDVTHRTSPDGGIFRIRIHEVAEAKGADRNDCGFDCGFDFDVGVHTGCWLE